MASDRRVEVKIDEDALRANVRALKCAAFPAGFLAVVKANAYGHGAVNVAKAIENDVDMFGTATFDEAENLRENGIEKPILVFGAIEKRNFNAIIKHQITPTVFSADYAKELNDFAFSNGQTISAHFEIDSGMGRLGFFPSEISKIYKYKNLQVDGIFSHFSDSDNAEKSKKQIRIFISCLDRLQSFGAKIEKVHIDNSGGIINNLPKFNMGRAGISMYGIYPSPATSRSIKLQPVMKITAKIVQIKTVPKGCGISYNSTYICETDRRIAIISIGYADGVPRVFSNKGQVRILDKLAPIVGTICMDYLMADVTDIQGVTLDTRAVILGEDGVTADEIAKLAGTIPYEILCNFSEKMNR